MSPEVESGSRNYAKAGAKVARGAKTPATAAFTLANAFAFISDT